MNSAIFNVLIISIVVLGVQQQVFARPNSNVNSRVKRVSDPHFSDLQTRVALHRINGIAITLPVAGGRNLDKIGRKRRSQSRLLETLFNESEEDQGDPREDRIETRELLFDYK